MFWFPHCLIILIVSSCEGKGESGVEVCEYEDANLLFPNTPDNYASDIRGKIWSKENGIRVASWMTSIDFVPSPSYGDRLMAIGENSIKIRNATRPDSGTYTLVLTSASTQVFIESTLYLDVIVPPTSRCIPNIAEEGDILKAVLPPDYCGIPSLSPSWMTGNQTLISNNISVLKLETGLVPGIYTACATGKSIRCFHGDLNTLCSNYTVSALQPQIQSSSVSVVGILIVIIFYIVTGVILYLVCWKWDSIQTKLFQVNLTDMTVNDPDEGHALMKEATTAKDLDKVGRTVPDKEFLEKETTSIIGIRDIKRHLIDQYQTMTGTALSPCYEENIVDVSQVYCELEIMSLGTEDKEGRENVIFHNPIFISSDTENIRPIPAIIIGECGSGKTTWSKNCVHQWCQYHANKESNLDMKDSTIPDPARFEILLYIQLKKKLEESSFLEHLRHTLFSNATDYYEYTMSCISKPRQPVLLLIDGLDEVTCNIEPIVHILEEKENLNCSIVITSRPNGLELLQEKVGTSLRLFQIHGMNLENSKKYASKVLDILSRSRGEILYADHFWKFANHMQVRSMCNIPLLCLSLILVWMEGKTISADVTDILLMIVEYYLRRAITREWYRAYIGKVLEQQHIDISMCITKTKQKQYIRDYGYLLKIISDVARNLWCLHMNVNTGKKMIENTNNTADDGTDVKLCLETGIVIKTFINKLGKTRSQVIFSHPLLFDMFVAFSFAMGKGESFSRYITTKKAVVRNSNMIHMLFQAAPNIVQELIKDINKIFDEDNEKDRNEKTVGSDRRLNCYIECNNTIKSWVSPAKWLKTLMCVDELSNAKLSLLTEGLKCTKDLTVFGLQLLENKNELIFRLPIIPKVQDLQLDIENCTLLLQDEQEWNKGNSSELAKLVIKSVNMDVKTTGYIVEAISTCANLRSLELCPRDDLDAQRLALRGQKILCGWGRLADSMKDMTKLSTVRLHNLHIGDHMPALLNSLCRCPSMEILDLMNLNEIGIGEILNIISSDRGLDGCTHYETKQSQHSNIFIDIFRNKPCKTLQLIKNAMSVKSWLTVSKQIEWLSPHIIHIEQVHQPGLLFKDLLQGIGKCAALNILTICSIRAENVPVVFSDLQHLHKLEKLTLCKISMPEISWKGLSETLARFSKLKELSLAHLEIKNCFIEVKKLSKLKFLEMRNVCLEESSWLKLGGEVVTLPYLERFELGSCTMSMNGHFVFMEKMKNSAFHVKMEKKSKVEDSEMLSVDMVVTSKK